MKKWIDSLIGLFFPQVCIYCGAPFVKGEEYLCSECLLKLPRTRYHEAPGNATEQLFWGKVSVVRASSFLHFKKGGITQQIVHHIKYRGEKRLGKLMGRLMANEMKGSSFFDGIDQIVPVPLHSARLKKRGYNQAEEIANGISEITGIPVCTGNLYRSIESDSQTARNVFGRWMNVRHIFLLHDPSRLSGKHILLVDDVLTSGATLVSCAETLERRIFCKISVLTLGGTQKLQ